PQRPLYSALVPCTTLFRSERRDGGSLEALRLLEHLREHELGLGIVDLARGADKVRVLTLCRDDEPRIHGDAVATHTGTGLEDVQDRKSTRLNSSHVSISYA